MTSIFSNFAPNRLLHGKTNAPEKPKRSQLKRRSSPCEGKCEKTWTEGPSFKVKYAPATKSLDFEAKVEKNTFLGISFAKMSNLDAIIIQNGASQKIYDITANGYSMPRKAPIQSTVPGQSTDLGDGWSNFAF